MVTLMKRFGNILSAKFLIMDIPMGFKLIQGFLRTPRVRTSRHAAKRHGKSSMILHSLTLRLFQAMVLAALLTSFAGAALALELPVPETLEHQYGLRRQTISVIEPHVSTTERPVVVRYVGLPMDALLTLCFGDGWNAPDAEVVFLARQATVSFPLSVFIPRRVCHILDPDQKQIGVLLCAFSDREGQDQAPSGCESQPVPSVAIGLTIDSSAPSRVRCEADTSMRSGAHFASLRGYHDDSTPCRCLVFSLWLASCRNRRENTRPTLRGGRRTSCPPSRRFHVQRIQKKMT